MKKIHCLIPAFLFMTTCLLAQIHPLKELWRVVDGLNIEGARIAQEYLREDQIWANLCVVLDRPFMDGVEWQKITDSNPFPLKEASISSYNEAQVNLAYATILQYYLTHAHELTGKPKEEVARIRIQVYRNTSGPRHLELLEDLLCQCQPEKGIKRISDGSKYELFTYFFPQRNVEIKFCYGTFPGHIKEVASYVDTDIVLSFSLVAGFHPLWESGTLLIPKEHIPFSLNFMILSEDEKYPVNNHLKDAIVEILKNQDEKIVEMVNNQFRSLNPEKNELTARKMMIEDFKEATLLQVDGMFNPSNLPETFEWK